MDLEAQEIATLLGITEVEVIQLASTGELPSYKIKENLRFNREEIQEWMMKKKAQGQEDSLFNAEKKGQERFNLFRALNKGEVLLIGNDDNKADVIRHSMKKLASKLKLDAEVLSELFIERENLMPTAVGHGFAIPHTRDFLLDTHFDVVSVVFLNKPIAFGALDGMPVHTLFFLFASSDKRHLSLLAKIAHLINSPSMRSLLSKKPAKAELLEAIQDWENSITPA